MRARRIAVAVLLTLGTLLWTAATFGVWAERQALDTDNWVDTSDRLVQNERIRTALALFLVDRLYQSAAVEARLRGVLPPGLDRLAGPAAAGLKEVARRNAPRLIGSAAALTAWREANRAAHRTFKAIIEGDVAGGGEVNLDLKTLMKQVAAGTGLPPGAADKLPPEAAELQVLDSDQLDAAQNALEVFKKLALALILLSIALFAAAIGVARDRRRTVLHAGGCIVFAGIAVLALRRLGGEAVVGALADAPNAETAAADVWSIGTSLLADAAQGAMLFGFLLATGAWLAGRGRRATALRRASAPALRDHPAAARVAVGAAILLLVLWGPVPWTERFLPLLAFTAAAFLWLEWIRRRALEEFPDVPAGEVSRWLRSAAGSMRRPRAAEDRVASLARLAELRERGVLDEAEFQREKSALLGNSG